MQRSRAPEGHERKLAGILPLLLQGEAQVHRHLGVDDAQDPGGPLQHIEAERLGHGLDRARRAPRVDAQ